MNSLLVQHLPEVKNLMRQFGVTSAFAFGSVVSDTKDTINDIDFIISFPESMDFEMYANNYFALAHALEKLLQKKVDLVTEKTLKNPYLLRNINSHKVQLI